MLLSLKVRTPSGVRRLINPLKQQAGLMLFYFLSIGLISIKVQTPRFHLVRYF